MTALALPDLLHVAATAIWLCGLGYLWWTLRLAPVATVDRPARLQRWSDLFRHRFGRVWLVLVMLSASGFSLMHASGLTLDTAPRPVQVMIGGAIASFALCLRIRSLLGPELDAAIAAQDWATGAWVLARIRRMVGACLLIGMAVAGVALWRLSW
ncbi:hypothetical protein G7007_04345 [Pseudomonas entomophila]|uniref:hypothetical protein n=1 Tax=Pseudomonas entomophila TaxID=312306 RepID=UPI0015E3406A|nr:hypothetical protein [Pseudomonas entomophila]MBA1192095.1 hypothetical protein [Pseudomonas entomophila]